VASGAQPGRCGAAGLAACLAAALAGGARAAAEGDRRASLPLRGCELALEARAAEPVLLFRPACAPTLEETRASLRALLAQLYPAGRIDPEITGLSLGRIDALPWLSQRVTEGALRSPGWDARSGAPRDGSPERFVGELLREGRLAAELAEVLAGFGAAAEIGAVEKVRVAPAGAADRLAPADAVVWLRLRPASP
jgi:hypothetical protein